VHELSDDRLKQLADVCRTLLRRSVLTLRAVPDREAAWLRGPGGNWPPALRDATESYGYDTPKVRSFHPTPRDLDRYLDVLAWLSWLQTQPMGPRDVRIIVARARDLPIWTLAQRHGCSDETIRRWEIHAIFAITFQFAPAIASMEDADAEG